MGHAMGLEPMTTLFTADNRHSIRLTSLMRACCCRRVRPPTACAYLQAGSGRSPWFAQILSLDNRQHPALKSSEDMLVTMGLSILEDNPASPVLKFAAALPPSQAANICPVIVGHRASHLCSFGPKPVPSTDNDHSSARLSEHGCEQPSDELYVTARGSQVIWWERIESNN